MGVEQDYKKAFILFSKAAQAGNAQAQFNLGALYDMGLGCEEDKEKAIEWCRKAAFQGHPKAKGIIQRMQQDGQIVF
jgi:TPR repeat protein